ncbi:MAG: urease accessory protein UreE [Granulosicoccaceae bacterium]
MLELNSLCKSNTAHVTTIAGNLRLDYDQRVKCRLRAQLEDGREVVLFLPRGSVLKDGDILNSPCGLQVLVVAAEECLSVCAVDDPLMFARACYHLGNRHVPLQIRDGELSYQHDHVLDDMLRGFGLEVHNRMASFHPENGAYSSHGVGHSHSHSHAH